MSYTSTNGLFRSLLDSEQRQFEEYALNCDPEPLSGDWHVLHPVCRRVWVERGIRMCPTTCRQCARDLDPSHWT